MQAYFCETFVAKRLNAPKDAYDEPELNTNSREKSLVYVWRLNPNLDATVCSVFTLLIKNTNVWTFKKKDFPRISIYVVDFFSEFRRLMIILIVYFSVISLFVWRKKYFVDL